MALSDSKLSALQKTLPPGRVFFDFTDHEAYTKDAIEQVYLPDALLFAESEADLVNAIKLCRENDIPLIIRGAGTGYSGGALAVNGGLLISIERMNKVEIDAVKKIALVGPGAITGDIVKAAEKHGLFYPPDPASYLDSTIAGNLAENAGGLRCKKYGITKDYVIGYRGLDASGQPCVVDHHTPYGMCDVLVGNEGTLFIFTEITLRLIDAVKPGKTIQATFEKAVDAARVVSEVTSSGIVPCIMEFMDRDAIECSNQYDPENRITPGAAMLLFETDGAQAEREAGRIIEICKKYRPRMLRIAEDISEREKLWMTRRNLSKAVKAAVKSKIAEDVCVPPSRLPELVDYVGELAGLLSLRVNCYGHAGDGNLHVNFLGMNGTAEENREIERGVALLFKKTLELDGTLTGEHGIGIAKREFLADEFDESTLGFMKRLKTGMDPENLLNPGKIFSK